MKSIPAAILDVSAPHSESSKSSGDGPNEGDLGVVAQSFTDLLSVQTSGLDGKAKCKNESTEQHGNLPKTSAAQSFPKVSKAEEERYGGVSAGAPPLPVIEVFGPGWGKSPPHASLERDVAARAAIGRPLNFGAAHNVAVGNGPVKSGPESAQAYSSASEKASGKIEGQIQGSPKMQAPSNGTATRKLPTSRSGSTVLTDALVVPESKRSTDLPTTRSLGEAGTTRPSPSIASGTSMTAIRDGSGLVTSGLSDLRKESLPAQASSQAESAKGGLTVKKPVSAEPARLTAASRSEVLVVKGSPISAIPQAHVVETVTGPSVKSSVLNPSANHSGSLDVTALSQAVLRPISAGGGTHTLLVAMHPAELGPLEAVVSLNQNGIQVALMPQTVMGHTALANSVEALKSQLAQGGMNVNISLQDPDSQSGNEARHQRQHGAPVQPAPPFNAKGASSPPLLASVSGQIHLVL